ncbi:unnamed protein product, partial [Staurois parvus]
MSCQSAPVPTYWNQWEEYYFIIGISGSNGTPLLVSVQGIV